MEVRREMRKLNVLCFDRLFGVFLSESRMKGVCKRDFIVYVFFKRIILFFVYILVNSLLKWFGFILFIYLFYRC